MIADKFLRRYWTVVGFDRQDVLSNVSFIRCLCLSNKNSSSQFYPETDVVLDGGYILRSNSQGRIGRTGAKREESRLEGTNVYRGLTGKPVGSYSSFIEAASRSCKPRFTIVLSFLHNRSTTPTLASFERRGSRAYGNAIGTRSPARHFWDQFCPLPSRIFHTEIKFPQSFFITPIFFFFFFPHILSSNSVAGYVRTNPTSPGSSIWDHLVQRYRLSEPGARASQSLCRATLARVFFLTRSARASGSGSEFRKAISLDLLIRNRRSRIR